MAPNRSITGCCSANPIDLCDEVEASSLPPTPEELDVVRELTPREARDFQRALAQSNARSEGHGLRHSARAPSGAAVRPGMGFQLKLNEDGERHFIWVKHIIRDDRGDLFLRGILLKRNADVHRAISRETGKDLHAVLPLRKNDLCMQLKSTPEGCASALRDESLVSIPLRRVKREREIVFTNHAYPAFSYREAGLSVHTDGRAQVEKHGVLCCRWKYVEEVVPGERRPSGYRVSLLEQEECDRGKGQPSAEMRRGYGDQHPATQAAPSASETAVNGARESGKRTREGEDGGGDNEDQGAPSKRRCPGVLKGGLPPTSRARTLPELPAAQEQYTLGGGCAGGGGAVRGAEMAGLGLKWLVDSCPIAADTLRQNWPDVLVREMEIQRFAVESGEEDDSTVDVVDVSFPCPGHSWRNKGSNPERDAINNTVLMCLTNLLQKCRPRVVTLEQTNHILTKNEGFFFRKVVHQITTLGYSVRWRVINMAEHDVCQARRRLMVMAACPGQKLPKWPAPTHGTAVGMAPRVTVGEAIHGIPEWATLHDVVKQKERFRARPLQRPLIDTHAPLRHLITTHGVMGLLREPDGDYDPTPRQQMRLQTFPDHHILAGSSKRDFTRQIGNAVPCVFAKRVFQEVVRALRESDEEGEAWRREVVTVE